MDFIDLFCGIGGFRFGLEQLEHRCVFSCDIDKHCRERYQINFGEMPFGDIKDILLKQIPKHDILCAGFPCQPFSISGKQGGFNDNRSLFYEIVRIVKNKKPKIVLLENVRNIITMHNGAVHAKMCTAMEELGYEVNWSILNASDYGIPQTRRRVYYVCIKRQTGITYTVPAPSYKQIYLEDVLDTNDQSKNQIIDSSLYRVFLTKKNSSYKLRPIRLGHINKAHQGERIYDPKGHAITLSASTGGMGRGTGLYLVDGQVRRLNVREAARTMGFPEKLKISDSPQSYRQLGNAVIPSIVTLIGNEIST